MRLPFLTILQILKRAYCKAYTWAIAFEFHKFGARTTVEPPARIQGSRFIQIGDHVFLGPNTWLSAIPRQPSPTPTIRIGNKVSCSGFCTITAVNSVIIEDSVLIARYVYISDHSHSFDIIGTPIKDQGITDISPVTICKGAWLGQSVVICPGVTIGKYAVVGANSVVKSSIPDYAVAVGAPARIIRITKSKPPNQADRIV